LTWAATNEHNGQMDTEDKRTCPLSFVCPFVRYMEPAHTDFDLYRHAAARSPILPLNWSPPP